MTWVAVAVAGAAVVGGAASYAGSKKQADASKKGANLQMQMFERLNAQQQPFIRSGYNSMGRLNTLLGLGGVPRGTIGAPNQAGYAPNPQGGMDMRIPSPVGSSKIRQSFAGKPLPYTGSAPKSNPRLSYLLSLRAQNGDTEAARMLGMQ